MSLKKPPTLWATSRIALPASSRRVPTSSRPVRAFWPRMRYELLMSDSAPLMVPAYWTMRSPIAARYGFWMIVSR